MGAETKRQRFDARLQALSSDLTNFIPHWRDITDYISPRTARYITIDYSKGSKQNEKIIDNTATISVRTLKSGMMAGITSPARPWFNLLPPSSGVDESYAVKTWLYDVVMLMNQIFLKSNLYDILPMVYACLALYGTAAMMIEEDDEDIIRCIQFPNGQWMISLNAKLKVDSMYRTFSMSCRQLVQQFGLENCSQAVQSMYESPTGGTRDTMVEVVHLIEPNDEHDPSKFASKHKPFRSVYYERGGSEPDKFLRESGYDEFPVQAPRWDLLGEDVYGYSPAMDALGDIKMLQLQQRRKLQAGDKMVNPPMIADASLRQQKTSTLPGGVTYIDGLSAQAHPGFRSAYDVNFNVDHARQDILETQARIKKTFFEDLMLMFSGRDQSIINPSEIAERSQEKVMVLGPVMERLNKELLNLIIDRTFAIMNRKGILPPAPPELQGQQLRVDYTSVMAQALKLSGSSNMDQVINLIGGLAKLKPEAIDKLNVDETIDAYANMHGVPPKMIYSEDQVKQLRAVRAKQQQMAQMAQMAKPMNDMSKAAKNMGETDTDGGMLAKMAGGQ